MATGLPDLLCEFPDDVVHVAPYDFTLGYQPADRPVRLSNVEALMQENEWVDEWGIGWKHAADGVGANPRRHPLKDWSQLEEYLRIKSPTPTSPAGWRRPCRRWPNSRPENIAWAS